MTARRRRTTSRPPGTARPPGPPDLAPSMALVRGPGGTGARCVVRGPPVARDCADRRTSRPASLRRAPCRSERAAGHARHDASRSPRCVRVQGHRNAESRSHRARGRPLRAGGDSRPADASGALVDLHQQAAARARRSGQRRLLSRRPRDDDGGAAEEPGIPDGRLRRGVCARSQVGGGARLREVLR